jgi:hypothetical protein
VKQVAVKAASETVRMHTYSLGGYQQVYTCSHMHLVRDTSARTVIASASQDTLVQCVSSSVSIQI